MPTACKSGEAELNVRVRFVTGGDGDVFAEVNDAVSLRLLAAALAAAISS